MCACGVSVCVYPDINPKCADWVNGIGYWDYGIACKDLCECEFRKATSDAVTPFTFCTSIDGEIVHLPSLFICYAQRTKSKAS